MHEVSSCFSKTFVITVVYVLKVHERKMRNISHEMKSCMRSKDKLGFARKNIASPVSRSPFYSLRKRKKSANSIESLMCSHPSYFGISHTRFRAKNFAVVESGLNRYLATYANVTYKQIRFRYRALTLIDGFSRGVSTLIVFVLLK